RAFMASLLSGGVVRMVRLTREWLCKWRSRAAPLAGIGTTTAAITCCVRQRLQWVGGRPVRFGRRCAALAHVREMVRLLGRRVALLGQAGFTPVKRLDARPHVRR